MPRIAAREYKVMLEREQLLRPRRAMVHCERELVRFMDHAGATVKGSLEPDDGRWIVFLDTPEHALYRAGIILRQRQGKDFVDLTLKAMSPDPVIAADAHVRAAKSVECASKFEEDISAPFRSRFARSATVTLGRKRHLDPRRAIVTDAVALFPALRKVRSDGRRLDLTARLRPVNGLRVFETVYRGATIRLGERKASLAVILWTTGPKGRPIVAEFSSRYKVGRSGIAEETAQEAYDFHFLIQRMPWARPGSLTKTEFVYRTDPSTANWAIGKGRRAS